MKKKFLATLLSLAMAASLVACGNGGDAPSPTTDAPVSPSAGTSSEGTSYNLAYAELGEGVWAIDYYMLESQYLIESAGSTFTYTSSDFNPDKMQSDIQSLLGSGIDGLFYYGAFPTITSVVTDMCTEAQVPFVMADQLPSGEYADIVQASEYFAGAVGSDPYEVGYQIGAYAAENGGTRALIIGGAEGDACHDGRTNGFTAGFEENGGEVVAVARVANMADAPVSASDLLTANPDVDVYYGATADFGNYALTSLSNQGRDDVMVYCTDADTSVLDAIREGRVIADGGAVVCTPIAACLLFNYLDGQPIKDEDGKAPIYDTCLNFMITAENVDAFNENWIQNHPFELEDYKQLMARYNPDASYDTFAEFIDNYSFETVVGE